MNFKFQFVFWLSLLLLIVTKNYNEADQVRFADIFFYDLCHLIFQVIGANIFYYWHIKRFLLRKRYLIFGASFLLCLYVLSVLNRIFIIYVAEPLFATVPQDNIVSILTDLNSLFFHYAFPIISGAFMFISVVYMLNYKNQRQQAIRLLKEKAELELKALKTQLNPHFLFNTLNNIYALSLVQDKRTPELLSRLSDILDYILYKGQHDFVSLQDEWEVIMHYIELEKLRYHKRLSVQTVVNIDGDRQVPPLLFLSLVENAFKHGAGKIKEQVLIKIVVNTAGEKTVFQVENTCKREVSESTNGIGLQNIRDQLVLVYGNNFEWKVGQEGVMFIARIVIP